MGLFGGHGENDYHLVILLVLIRTSIGMFTQNWHGLKVKLEKQREEEMENDATSGEEELEGINGDGHLRENTADRVQSKSITAGDMDMEAGVWEIREGLGHERG